MSFVDLELWLVEVVKSDVREWRVFAEPVTYLLKQIWQSIWQGPDATSLLT